MKVSAILLLLASSLSAQVPQSMSIPKMVALTSSSSSSTPYFFDFQTISNLYIELFADSAANWSGNTNGGPTLGSWLDQSGRNNSFTNSTASSHWVPPYRFGLGPTNGWYVEFTTNTTGVNAMMLTCTNNTGSNQPTFVCMACKLTTLCLFDASAGSREQFVFRNTGDTPNSSTLFAGTIASPPSVPSGLVPWCILSCVLSGANSYVRTNGVLLGTAVNPGTGGLGKMILGIDQTFAAPYVGRMAAVLVYGLAPSTNDLQLVEKSLSAKYGHIFADGL